MAFVHERVDSVGFGSVLGDGFRLGYFDWGNGFLCVCFSCRYSGYQVTLCGLFRSQLPGLIMSNKFTGGVFAGGIQYQNALIPETYLDLCTAAFSDGVRHLTELRCVKWVGRGRWLQVNFQQGLTLGQTDVLAVCCQNSHTIIRGKSIALFSQYDNADTATKPNAIKGNPGNGDHNGAGKWEIVALYPLVGTGKGCAAVFFDIPHASVKMVHLPIQTNGAI